MNVSVSASVRVLVGLIEGMSVDINLDKSVA